MTNPYYEGVLKPLNLKHLEAYWRTKGCRWYALMYDDARRYDAESPGQYPDFGRRSGYFAPVGMVLPDGCVS